MRLKFGGKIISENDLIIFLRWPLLAPCFYVVQLFLAVVHEYVKKVGGHPYVVVLHVIVFFCISMLRRLVVDTNITDPVT